MANPDLFRTQFDEGLFDPATTVLPAEGQARLVRDGTGAAPQCIGRQESNQRFLRARERVVYDGGIVVVSALPERFGKSSKLFPE